MSQPNPNQYHGNLNKALEWILKIEGGLSDDPSDQGGKTKFGISQKQYPDIDIAGLTIEEAREIYRVDYYDAYRCSELPPAIGLYLFDGVVNHRASSAIKFLQIAVESKPDGIIGPMTIAATFRTNTTKTIHEMNITRTRYYFDIVTARSDQAKFLDGWLSRIFLLNSYLFTNGYQQ
jgi:lysozyme family protein